MALNGTCGIQTYPIRVDPSGTLVIDLEEDGAAPPWRVADYRKYGTE